MSTTPTRGLSLREEAALRAASRKKLNSTTTSSNLASSWHGGQPKQQSSTTTPNLSSSMTLAAASPSSESARNEWKTHGEMASQVLEDRRRKLSAVASPSVLAPPSPPPSLPPPPVNTSLNLSLNSSQTHSNTISPTNFPPDAKFCLLLLPPEPRVDVTNRPFTSYLISVTSSGLTSPHPLVVEHRYSEFSKLQNDLVANGVNLKSPFPAKSLSGRLGNWTPAAMLSPKASRQLVVFRKTRLDAWLVELAEVLNSENGNGNGNGNGIGGIGGALRQQVLEFLLVSSGGRPPCDRPNFVSANASANASANDANDASANANDANANANAHHAGVAASLNNPAAFTLGSEIRKATYTLLNTCFATSNSAASNTNTHDRSIPLDLLHQAKGLAFMTVIKAGFVLSGRYGTGLVIRRTLSGGWSAPSAIGTVGVGWGAQIGGDITEYMIVCTTDKAVRAFSGSAGITLGAEIDVAVGPLGRSIEGNVVTGGGEWLAPAYSYAHSKGLFAGISLEGSIVHTRNEVNAKFYGRSVDVKELLNPASVYRPRAAECLYEALERALSQGIEGWRPSVALRESGWGGGGSEGHDANLNNLNININGSNNIPPSSTGTGTTAI